MLAEFDSRWYSPNSPEVSIVILNHNTSAQTARCLHRVFENTTDRKYEVVVVDNGSDPIDFRRLSALQYDFRLVHVPISRHFSEGNNIGVENSRGKFLVFLSNEIYVEKGWLNPLIAVLETQFASGGAGPKLLSPAGKLQSAGAFLDSHGAIIERGKNYVLPDGARDSVEIVDCCAAECFATTRALFEQVAGFDATYDPAGYEVADYCLKMASLDRFIYCSPNAVAREAHEGSVDAARQADLARTIDESRQKFLSRWQHYLSAREAGDADSPPSHPTRRYAEAIPTSTMKPAAVFYTPHDLIPAGGERYLLTAASALIKEYRVHIATEARYSQYRLGYLERELSLDLSGIRMITRSELAKAEPIDLFVHMGNHQFPTTPAAGRHNVFICQFPFPFGDDNTEFSRNWNNFAGYDEVVVYSKCSRETLRKKLDASRTPAEVSIVYPPVPIARPFAKRHPTEGGRLNILSIGRFYTGGHNKRHDLLIDALARLRKAGVEAELHLAGALHTQPHNVAHLHGLRRMAEGLPVHFHVNAAPALLRELLSRATIYWHATGFGIDQRTEPEKCEHFGISIIEGMAAGCVPFVVANGGPLEFVRDGETGFRYTTIDELVSKTRAIARDPHRFAAISRAAAEQAEAFSETAFKDNWRSVVDRLGGGVRSKD